MLRDLWERLIAAASGGAGGATLVNGRLPVQLSLTVDANDVSAIHEPADNTAAAVTFTAPGAGFRWVLVRASGYYTAAPTAQLMAVESPDATIRANVPMGTAALTLKEISGVIGTDNGALIVRLPAGGAAVGGRLYATVQKARVQAV